MTDSEDTVQVIPAAQVLGRVVEHLGGQERAGQVRMADAVSAALESDRHLLVQAGTGTGKSLAYLVPAMLHPGRVVVATATLALQHQLIERDLPALVEAIAANDIEVDTSTAVLKGRANYACLHRVREGVPDDQGTLVDIPQGSLGEQVLRLREWVEDEAESGGTGERDHAPRHTDQVWRQVSVSHRECLGSRCSFVEGCFAEQAREKAARSQLVVTNHALLAIDAIEGVRMIPEYDRVVIDEAHEFVARVTQAATEELTPAEVDRVANRAERFVESDQAADLGEAADQLRSAIADGRPGRVEHLDAGLTVALGMVRDRARALLSAFSKDLSDDAAAVQSKAAAQELFATAERMASGAARDVLWISERPDNRGGDFLKIAPLDVSGPVRERLLAEKVAVFTSATLMLGGDFTATARSLGMRAEERDAEDGWTGIDVGSPFDYAKQSILYVAKELPPPGRDGLGEPHLAAIVELVEAADGRALGLFSSRRAAEQAGEHLRAKLGQYTILVQGDAQLPELTSQFVGDPHTVLLGTLSLWQGLDVPGDTCQLVIIDRIPFPRPDDPLMSARQRAADQRGGNGFMEVAATHAALLLAQGSGRLIRRREDRGVVACLDPRLVTARYGGFLKGSLPAMWTTTERDVAVAALERLATSAAKQP